MSSDRWTGKPRMTPGSWILAAIVVSAGVLVGTLLWDFVVAVLS